MAPLPMVMMQLMGLPQRREERKYVVTDQINSKTFEILAKTFFV